MTTQKISLLQHVYQQLRNAAMDWCKTEDTDEHCVFNGGDFWVQLSRPANIKSIVFRDSAARFLEKIEEDGLINELLPIKFSIRQTGTVLDIEGEPRKIGESKDQLLATMMHEIVRGFQLAEEAHFQDQGRRPPYEMSVKIGGGTFDMIMKMVRSGMNGDFNNAKHRLWEYIQEYSDDHILKPKVSGSRTVGLYTVSFKLPGLNEELSPNDFALKIAHGIVKAIEVELKRKGAHNAATLEVSRFNNGVPRIEATLNGRSALTRAAVERAMKDVVAHELPDGNLLNLAGKFGGLGTAQGSNRILLAIKPIQPDTSTP